MAVAANRRPAKKGGRNGQDVPGVAQTGGHGRSRWLTPVIAVLAVAAAVTVAAFVLLPSKELQDHRAIDRIRASMAANYPDLGLLQIRPSPAPGIYEIDTTNTVLYADATGSYLLAGTLVAAQSHEDLTARRLNELNGAPFDFEALPFALAIKEVKGSGGRRLVIFEDPLCPFCARLEGELTTLNDVTIYRFLFPLENIRQGATAAAHAIWCANDRVAAWNDWMARHVEPKGPGCESDPIADIQSLAKSLKVSGTPTLLFPSGRRVYGFQSKEILEDLLSKEQSKNRPPGG